MRDKCWIFFTAAALIATIFVGCAPAKDRGSSGTPDSLRIEEGWNIIPMRVETEPQGGGWQLLTVDLAIENASGEWGQLIVDDIQNVWVETTEGYTYYAERGSIINSGVILPPGFRTRGHILVRETRWNCTLSFQIAEGTRGVRVFIPQYSIRIYSPEADEIETIIVDTPLVLDLDSDVRDIEFPTDLPPDSFRNLGDPIEVAEKGTITIIGFEIRGDRLILEMVFDNASDGYGQEVQSHFYIIADDGMVSEGYWQGVTLSAGPTQSVTGTDAFTINPGVGNMKLIYFGEDGAAEIFEIGSSRGND